MQLGLLIKRLSSKRKTEKVDVCRNLKGLLFSFIQCITIIIGVLTDIFPSLSTDFLEYSKMCRIITLLVMDIKLIFVSDNLLHFIQQ